MKIGNVFLLFVFIILLIKACDSEGLMISINTKAIGEKARGVVEKFDDVIGSTSTLKVIHKMFPSDEDDSAVTINKVGDNFQIECLRVRIDNLERFYRDNGYNIPSVTMIEEEARKRLKGGDCGTE